MEHLIRPEWFEGLNWFFLLVIVAGAMTTLIKGADWLVAGASGIAYQIGIPKVIVGATIVSLGTTSPEAAVSVMAAWSGQAGLALGNAVGSIIADTGFIFGIGCLITVLPADRFVLNRQGWVQFFSGLALAITCYAAFVIQGDEAQINRIVGIIFLVALVAYLRVSIHWARKHPHDEPFVTPEEMEETVTELKEDPEVKSHGKAALAGLIIVGLVVVVFSSHILICAVTELAKQFHIPQVVIAATLVAMGTSLPELVVGITAIWKGHPELLVGNVIGADILNVLFVIGASAAAIPLSIVEPGAAIPRIFLYVHLPTMLIVLVLFRFYIASAVRTGSFRRWFGAPLVMLYVVYVSVLLLTSGLGAGH